MKKLPIVNGFKSGLLSISGQEDVRATFNGTVFVQDDTGKTIPVFADSFQNFIQDSSVLSHKTVLADLKASSADDIVLIYHGGCPDGVASAVVVIDALGADLQIIAGHYARPLSGEGINLEGKTVLLCDFSYPLVEMESIVNQAYRVIFLDHHKTPLQSLAELLASPNVFTFASTHYSGASLTWNFFNPNQEPPLFIQYIEDGDLYTFNLPDSRNLVKGFHSVLEKSVAKNLFLLDNAEVTALLPQIKMIGQKLNDEAVREAKGIIKQGRMIASAYGHSFPLINATPDHTNLIGELIYTTENVPFVMIYTVLANRVKISMRSNANSVDVAKLAESIFTKGGGHKTAAAGFMPLDQFYSEVLSTAVEYAAPKQCEQQACGCGNH